MLSVPSTGHLCCVDLANLVSASLLVVHTVSHVLATTTHSHHHSCNPSWHSIGDLLVLNMTVAVGTINGLTFYANVVYANKSILLPFQETNFIIVFISWLNLELGIDTCYFPGMDTYTKTWIQLSFPSYVIYLVVLVIIIISSYSFNF